MTDAQALPLTVLLLIVLKVIEAALGRISQGQVKKHVTEQVGGLKVQVDNVETKMLNTVEPAVQKADDAKIMAQQAIDMFNKATAAFTPIISGLEGVIRSKDVIIDRLENGLKSLEVRVGDLESENEDKEKRITGYKETVDSLMDTLAEMQKNSVRRDGQLSTLEAQVTAMGGDLMVAKKDLEAADAEILKLRADLDKAKQDLDKTSKELADALARIKELEIEREREQKATQVEKERLTKELADAHLEVEQLRTRVKDLEEQVRVLEGKLKEKESVRLSGPEA